MRKLITGVSIILLLAGSLEAATVVSCARVGTTASFTVSYMYDGIGSAPRAFALDITTSIGTIAGVTAAKTGESTSASKGFGIFPGTIVIDTAAGTISSVGSPIAPWGTPGALHGIGYNGVTVEMGSLYADSTGKPATSGTLVTIALNGFVSGSAGITIVGNAARGSLILEDGTSVPVSSVCSFGGCDCFCSSLPTYSRWVSSGKPSCWCPPTSVTGCPTGGTGYQCVGDAAQDKAPISNYRVYTSDLGRISASWKKKIGDTGYDACADICHDSAPISGYGVYTCDLGRISTFWKKTDAQLNVILGVGTTGGYCGSCATKYP